MRYPTSGCLQGTTYHLRYMWLALPAFGFFLPSPMWHMKRQDCGGSY